MLLLLLLPMAMYVSMAQSEVVPEIKVEFESTLGGMVEAMTEIQGRADTMMEEIRHRQGLLGSLGSELERTVVELEGVQDRLEGMERRRRTLEEETGLLEVDKLELEEGLQELGLHIEATSRLASTEETRLVRVRNEVVPMEEKLGRVKEELKMAEEQAALRKAESVKLEAEMERRRTEVERRRTEAAAVEERLRLVTRQEEDLSASLSKVETVSSRAGPLVLPALGVSVLLNVLTALSLAASALSPSPAPVERNSLVQMQPPELQLLHTQQDLPPRPASPPPAWLQTQAGPEHRWPEQDPGWQGQVQEAGQEHQQYQDPGWQDQLVEAGIDPQTVQTSLQVSQAMGPEVRGLVQDFWRDEIAGLRPEE